MLALVVDTLVLVASLAWAGGLFTVGAVAAPAAFRSGSPQAGDIMTTVFQRFDRVAVVLAVLVLALEGVALVTHRDATPRYRAVRLLGALGMAASIGLQAGYFTPTITRLHREGVHRGQGPRGQVFEQVHHASSLGGRAGVISALALAVAVVYGRRGRDEGDERSDSSDSTSSGR